MENVSRHHAGQNTFPWTADLDALAGTAAAITAANTGYIPTAIAVGEFKADFINLAGPNLGKIFLTSTADAQGNRQNLATCFQPDSKTFRLDANTKYGNDGVVTTGTCSVATACYWCIKN